LAILKAVARSKRVQAFLSPSAEVECSSVPEVGTAASQSQKEPANYIRGQAFHSITDAAASLLGPSIRTEMLENLSEPLKRAFQYGSLVRSGWFPIEWHAELHRAFACLDSGPNESVDTCDVR
jgi:hypothetical protein